MTPEQRAALEARRDELERKARARRDNPGYERNVAHIEQLIAEIDEALNVDAGEP